VLITEAVAQRKDKPIYFPRGQQHKFQSQVAAEEEEWDARRKKGNEAFARDGPETRSFEEFRWKNKAAGVT
jgi:ATP-dependent Clp protease ATP-binding subunit ClpX